MLKIFTEGINQKGHFLNDNQTYYYYRRSQRLLVSIENARFKTFPHWHYSAGPEVDTIASTF